MDGSGLKNCETFPAEVMVQSREDEGLPPPAVLLRGFTMQESISPLIHPPGRKGLCINQSPENTAALPGDGHQKRPLSSQDAMQAPNGAGPPPVDGSATNLVAENSSCVLQTPTSKSRCAVPPRQGLPIVSDPMEPSTPALQNSSPAVNLTPAKEPKKGARESKVELLKMKKTQDSAAPLVHPPCREGLGSIQSPEHAAALPNDSPQKRALSTMPALQDTLLAAADSSPVDGGDKTLVLQTSAKAPKKRGRKSKAELLLMRMAQEAEAQTLVESRKSDSENVELELTQISRPAPLLHPPGRKGLGVIQSPENTAALPNDSPQKRALSTLPGSQDTLLAAADSSPVDGGDKSLASEDSLVLQTSAKVPKKRGRKSKAELLLMRMAQEAEAQTLVESRQSDSENVELTQSGRPRRRAAKTALKQFQVIADEWAASGRASPPKTEEKVLEETGKRCRKRKADDSDDDFVVSEDVLQQEREEVEDDSLSCEEEEESDDDLSFFRRGVFAPGEKVYASVKGTAANGLHNSIMAPVWGSAAITMDFREAHHSDWEYPEWVPLKDSWHFISHSEAEIYLPLQTASPPFCIRREGLEEDSEPCVLDRFQSLPPHPQRHDVTFFVGGPVWSLDWCPTLWGSASCQYVALYCHRGMDDRHRLDVTHTGPALLQLWRLGALSLDQGGDSAASFTYGLAVDDGCIWDLKFCPSGGWEPPNTLRKGSEMARLGLLAVAYSSGHVQIYSLPHPESLQSHWRTQGKDSVEPTICKVDCVVRLHVGSIKACSPGENGQCFTVAWQESKPHRYLAAGFHDGTVAIWDLKTKSVLQRVRQGRVIKQYPFHSFPAHDSAVHSIEWCKADSNFFVTCGRDRHLKFWDLRRLHAPVNNIKRFQGTEMSWLLPYCGVAVAQDNCYASQGLCGIHYVDSGFLGYKPYFATPRKGTVWSISGSDWLSILASGDVTGEVMVTLLPSMNAQSINTKRQSDRRFPVYKVDFLSCAPPSVESPVAGDHVLSGPLAESLHWEHFKPKSFRAATRRFSLLLKDTDLTDFHGMSSREPVKRMQANELKGDLNMERVQLEAIHKVRFNPNLDAYTWIVSGGHSGLVRVHCARGFWSSVGQKMIQEKRTRFQALYEAAEMVGELEYSPEVQHCVVEV